MIKKLCVFVLLLTLVSGFFSPADAATYKLGNQYWPAWIPLSVATQKGYYKKYGATIEEVAIPDYDDMMKSIASGKTQFGVGMLGDYVRLVAKGAPVTVVAEIDWSHGGDKILISKKLGSLKDLKGKKVGVDKGTVSHFFLIKALQKVGLTEKDVIQVQATAEESAVMAAAGKLDASVTWEPDASMAVKKGTVKVAITSKQIPGVMPEVLAVHNSVLKSDPKAVVAVLKGWMEGVVYVQKKPADLRAIANKGGYRGENNLKSDAEMYGGLAQMALHSPKVMAARLNGPVQNYIKEFGQYLLAQKLITKVPPASAVVNASFLQQALK